MTKDETAKPTFAHWCQYLATKVLAWCLQKVPLSWAAAFGRGLGWCFYTLDKRHRLRVQEQVCRAMGETVTPADGLRIAREMYRHFGLMLVEFVRMPLIGPDEIDDHVQWNEGREKLQQLMAEGNGLILATGHLGHWEMVGYATYKAGLVKGAIARPLNNPLLDRFVIETRTAGGGEVYDKFGALRHALRDLKSGQGFVILMDQDAGKRGVFLPFFGIPCSTIPTVGDMAVRTGAPVVVVGAHRTGGPMQFTYKVKGPFRVDPEADPKAESLRILQQSNDALEELIREEPAQWLWLHRRWKTRPPEEVADGL